MTLEDYRNKLCEIHAKLLLDNEIDECGNEAFVMAEIALGKQRPVTATERHINNNLIYYVCPACEYKVNALHLSDKAGFCVNCGQFLAKIDLSEYEKDKLI